MKLGGGKKRRDGNEPAILEALHAYGVQTWQINGCKLPDVIALFRGRWTVFGIKTPKGRLRPGEDLAPWPLVRSVEEAIRLVIVVTNGETESIKNVGYFRTGTKDGEIQIEKRVTRQQERTLAQRIDDTNAALTTVAWDGTDQKR